jgi:hypothetical protein
VTSFDRDIRPLFTEDDRTEMEYAFDLWSYDDVVGNAENIYERVADGTMPCFESWSDTRVMTFRRWMNEGFPP